MPRLRQPAPVSVGLKKGDGEIANGGVGVGGVLSGAGRAIAKSPSPIANAMAEAVNGRGGEVHQIGRRAVARSDMDRDRGQLAGRKTFKVEPHPLVPDK